jgi:hypothetical protein
MKIITSILLEIKDALNGIMNEDERKLINVNNVDSFKHSILWGRNRHYDKAFTILFNIMEHPLSCEAKELLSKEFGADLAW